MRRGSLTRRLRLILVSVVVVMTIAFLVSTFLMVRKEETDSAVREAELKLTGLSGSISSSIESYLELSRLIMMDKDLAVFLRAGDDREIPGLTNDAKYGIQAILNVTNGVESVYVFRRDGRYTCTKGSVFLLDGPLYSEEYWPEEVLAQRGRAIEYVNGSGTLRKINGSPFISIERAVYDLNSQQLTGYLMMLISGSVIDQTVSSYSGSDLCVVGLDGTYVSGNQDIVDYYERSMAFHGVTHITSEYQGKRVLISASRIEGEPLVVMSLISLDNMSIPGRTVGILVFLMAVMFIILAVIGRFVSHNITAPVYKLSKAMEVGEGGELKPIDFHMPNNEIGNLKDSYNAMVSRIGELIDELLAKEQSIQRAEMRVLQEQIKPHFLYNSIGTISALALENGSEEVSSALETMGRFYRNFLSKGDREISLEKEVTIVKDYLALQKLRYGDIIQDEYDIEDEAKSCIVPKLTLQPLVENCIYHGIRPKGEPGVIKVTCKLKDGMMHLSVYDTGVGMSSEMIEKLTNRDRRASGDEASFGLWGTIERVRYYSHMDDVVRITSEEGEFTCIELILPASKCIGSPEVKPNVQGHDNRR